MSFIQVNLGEDIKEKSNVPAGPYTLQIEDIGDKPSKAGSNMLTIRHNIQGHPDAKKVINYITLPTEGDDEEAVRNKSVGLKRYLTLVSIEFTDEGFDIEELYGATFEANLEVEMVEPDGGQPYEQNRLVTPFLA